MAFTVHDPKDLLELLERHPEWKNALRASPLGEEVLRLPEVVRELAGEIRALAGEVRALAEAQRRTESRVDTLDTRLADLLGRDLERQYRERAFAYFQRILKAIRPVEPVTLQRVLDDAVNTGRITEEEKQDLLLADVLVLGRHQGGETYLVAGVSGLVGSHDVERAARRAEVLRRATEKPSLAAVAGHRMEDAAEVEARVRGVWRVLDGVTLPPEG